VPCPLIRRARVAAGTPGCPCSRSAFDASVSSAMTKVAHRWLKVASNQHPRISTFNFRFDAQARSLLASLVHTSIDRFYSSSCFTANGSSEPSTRLAHLYLHLSHSSAKCECEVEQAIIHRAVLSSEEFVSARRRAERWATGKCHPCLIAMKRRPKHTVPPARAEAL
jgi:hypothetical protein